MVYQLASGLSNERVSFTLHNILDVCDLGENILHIAIVNEDPAMVKFLLDVDTDGIIHKERAFGIFFSCDDQTTSRKDKSGTELITIDKKTDYKGTRRYF